MSDLRGEDGNGLASDEKLASNRSASDKKLALEPWSAHRRRARVCSAEPAAEPAIKMD
jgi:hypothetical protein